LPDELARAWEELARSALLTPYRVLAQAVTSERCGFAYYSYLAARADDPAVRRAAEHLAGDALRRAAQLRRHRREAWRRERRLRLPSPATTPEELARQAAPLLAEAAAVHSALAAAAAAEGDASAADLLRELASAEARESGLAVPSTPLPAATAERRRRALIPLERLSELYEAAAGRAPSESMLAAAQTGLELTVARLRRVSSIL
jgi:rubrerythrin